MIKDLGKGLTNVPGFPFYYYPKKLVIKSIGKQQSLGLHAFF